VTEPSVRASASKIVVLAVVLVAAALLSLQLLAPPVIGLANNGDFERVMGPVGFQYLTQERAEKYFFWINTKFAYAPPGWYSSGLITSELILARVARAVAEPFSSDGLFDIRVLGGVHILLLLAGLGLLAAAMAPLPRPAQWVGAVLLVLVFTDVGYAAPFNSFYSQTASLLFLLLTLGVLARWVARPGPDPRFAAPFFLFAGLFVLSKPQEAIQAPWLALAGLRLAMAGEGGAKVPRRLAPLAGAVLLCVLGAWYYRKTPPEIADVARYHKVFMELLPDSPDPGQDLADLGLDPSWTTAIGTTAYAPAGPFNDAAFRSAFLGRFSYARLARFYLTHPARLFSAIRRGGLEALRLRHPRFGNFERGAGFPPGTRARTFAWWSDGRLALPGHPLVWIGLLFLGNAIAVGATYRRASSTGRLAREGIVLLMAMASTAFTVCVLSNAHGDLARHFYVFHALCDLVVIADVVWAASRRSGSSRVPAS
jgi:hypothetical protein